MTDLEKCARAHAVEWLSQTAVQARGHVVHACNSVEERASTIRVTLARALMLMRPPLPHATAPLPLLRQARASAGTRARPVYAVGLQGAIQATRDTTAAAFKAFQAAALPVALPLFAVLLCYVGFGAWREGNAMSKKARTSKLTGADFGLLCTCLLLDLAGGGSFVLGGGSDLIWAPASSFVVFSLFESSGLAALQFVKEALPATDVLPVTTLAWLVAYAYPESTAASIFELRRPQLGNQQDDFGGPGGFD